MGAVKKLTDAVAGFFSEAARARQEVERAEVAVAEAQRLFDASPSQAAGENVMAKKRELEHAKLFVDRAERLGAEEQRRAVDAQRDEQRRQLTRLEHIASTEETARQVTSLVEAQRASFEALAKLDRDVMKLLHKATEAARAAEQIRAQLEGRAVDRNRVAVAVQALGAQERLHAVHASSMVQRAGLLDNLRWLARL